jgi:hypothetical protein
MLVSAAIQDYNAPVSKYFMIDAAIAIEAYDNSSSDVPAMRHPDWVDYGNRLWATEWHQLFDEGDWRRALTWRGRFANIVSMTYNFYSSGEEVLERHEGTPLLIGVVWQKERYVWCKQEKLKGQSGLLPWQGSTYGGWGFNSSHYLLPWNYTFGSHTNIPDEELLSQPFFDDGGFGEPLYHNSGSSYAFEYQPKLLAQMIPALSLPVGANLTSRFNDYGERNFNMDTAGFKNGWGRNDSTYQQRWLHSDIKDMSYLYTYKVFNKFVSEGVLQ